MTLTVWVARAVLAAVFAWAAFSKAIDRPGTVLAAVDLGVARRAAGPVALALPLLEALAAALTLVPATSEVGALLALVLLTAFSVAIAVALRAGRRPPCHCFGARSSRPIGADSLVRNAALMLLGIVILTGSS